MSILWTLIIGLIVGIVAKFLMPGRDPGGFIITTLLGIAGAFLAHFIGRSMGWYAEGEPAGFIASVVGAIVLLAIYRMVAGRKSISDRR
ncbi:MAG TPA: GlsB/YeaQ/YmgE family stress response membrane protein [Verrucomicrobiae bacterium]